MNRYDKFKIKAFENERLHLEWRKGQNFFNTLSDEYPELAEEVRGTPLDPFYKFDDELAPFLHWLGKRFEEME